ncbi:PREDICTED: CD82 antigen-like, partial [Cyprinodon variegatus]|uniref:CD82 antigen-like n=1 Tax=Cyprinodon variegatus TaxID=28743 RepID=UPI000742A378
KLPFTVTQCLFCFLFNLLCIFIPSCLFFLSSAEESSDTVRAASYIFIGVGALSMAMGFFGCIGAIYEIRCLLGLYFTCLLLILVAQVTAGVLVYFQRDLLKHEMSEIIRRMIVNYTGQNKTTEHAWDLIQKKVRPPEPLEKIQSHSITHPLLYFRGCMTSVEKWLMDNCGIILGICVGVAVVELLGMILSMCLCKSVVREDYSKVPKY